MAAMKKLTAKALIRRERLGRRCRRCTQMNKAGDHEPAGRESADSPVRSVPLWLSVGYQWEPKQYHV
jgi:hypothetical protein